MEVIEQIKNQAHKNQLKSQLPQTKDNKNISHDKKKELQSKKKSVLIVNETSNSSWPKISQLSAIKIAKKFPQ